jgi:hypothetical protein
MPMYEQEDLDCGMVGRVVTSCRMRYKVMAMEDCRHKRCASGQCGWSGWDGQDSPHLSCLGRRATRCTNYNQSVAFTFILTIV